MKKLFHIESDAYETFYYTISAKTLFLHRKHYWKTKSKEIDVYGKCWHLFFTGPDSPQINMNHKNKLISLNAPSAVFVPPFGVVEWNLPPGFLEWFAITGEETFPDMPNTPVLLPWSYFSDVHSLNQIKHSFSRARDVLPIGKMDIHSPIAKKIKNLIDTHYTGTLSLDDLSAELKMYTYEVTRQFKKCYGLTPIQYRNKLRIFDSVRLMIYQKRQVTEACFESGFADFSRFFRNFKKYLESTPSQFLCEKTQDFTLSR